MKRNNKMMYIFVFFISFCFMGSAKAIYNDSKVGTYEDELAKFPSDYKTKIETLHKIYPNAVFVAQDKFFYWGPYYKEVTVKWNDMLSAEKGARSLISANAKSSFKTSTCGQKSSNGTCSWYHASEEAISYYMDPRNFLDEKHVFMFESQYYKDYQTLEGIKKILAGTFMDEKKCPGSGTEGNEKTYAEVILEAAKLNDISPYMLAARLRQEQGSGKSALISGEYKGYEGYYNYFNIQASGTTDKQIIENGLKCAKGELKSDKGTLLCPGNNWTSPYLSILGGSKFIYKKYIGINDTYNVKGQMTNYLQKWDPYGPQLGGHQYMQNIQAPYSEAESTYKSYSSYSDFKNYKYVFYLPVYQNMPGSLNIKVDGSYLVGINVGASQTSYINKIKSESPNATVEITKNVNNKTNNLATGDVVKIKNDGKENTYTVVIYGEVNGDSKIDKLDYLEVLRYYYGYTTYKGAYLKAADINKSGTPDKLDYLAILRDYYGYEKIKQ